MHPGPVGGVPCLHMHVKLFCVKLTNKPNKNNMAGLSGSSLVKLYLYFLVYISSSGIKNLQRGLEAFCEQHCCE